MAPTTRLQIRRTAVINKVQRIARVAETVLKDPSQLLSLEVRVESLDDLEAEFSDVQTQIEANPQIKEGATLLDDQMAIREQFEDEVYAIKAIYRKLTRPSPSTGSISPQRPANCSNVQLPKLNLPTFSGDYLVWNNFSDLFLTLIDANTSLSSIEKFQYLKLSLLDEPLRLIKNIPVSAANYDIAWDTLKNRYDNKRLIVDQHLDKLLNLPVIVKPTFFALRDFLNIINENVSALTILDLPVASWSYILVAIVIRKLDFDTRNKWEATLKRDVLPKFTDLVAFLEHIAESLEWQVVEDKSKSLQKPSISSRPSSSARLSSSSFNTSSRKQSYAATFVTHAEPSDTCVVCRSLHSIYKCKEFKEKSPCERFDIIKQNRLCINCLRPGHRVTTCPSNFRCTHCKAQHHSMLHFDHAKSSRSTSPRPPVTIPSTSSTSAEAKVLLTGSTHIHSTVILSTAVVAVQDSAGIWQPVRVLLDCASQASYMSESCHQRLGLRRQRSHTPIYALGDIELEAAKGITTCSLKPIGSSSSSFKVTAIIVRRISGDMPTSKFEKNAFSHLEHLKLADPNFDVPSRVDMLLGADLFPHLILGGRIVGNPGSPVALETIFGWIVMGEVSSAQPGPTKTFHLMSSIGSLLERFWEVEEIPSSRQPQTVEDARCESIFRETFTRSDAGRYTVSLPFVDPVPTLGDSYKSAVQCYYSLRRRLAANPALQEDYDIFMRDYLESGHMSLVPSPETRESQGYFIPHHCVLKPHSTSTKLRVVFNASKKTSNNLSLNDIMLTGPPLQQDLSSILVRFRFQAYVMTADVKQMYRQITIHPQHRQFQRILWNFDSNSSPLVYELNTVTYGLSCAPYLALRTLQQLGNDDGHNYPLATTALRSDTYVDDVITGCDSLQDAIKLRHELTTLFAAGGFDLRKWTSNHPDILSTVPSSHQQQPNVSIDLDLTNELTIKVLGLHWNPQSDIFSYNIQTKKRVCSKRIILSEIAKIFDPLGLLTPLTMAAKIILQRLWSISLDWDETPPIDTVNRWEQLHGQLNLLAELKIPRYITQIDANIDLVGFCDASEAGYAAVIYIRSSNSDTNSQISLLCAKSRVAPLKRLSLPRLELCNALLSFGQKHPLLLPQHSRLTELIIEHYHQLHLHPGTQTLIAILAQKFWIISARNAVRKQLCKCQRCFRCNPNAPTPLMGNLPEHRVTKQKPFQIVGVDYGGPFTITFNRSKGIRTQKAYLCLFVCFATKALHLELASSLSTDAFLAALRRFIARRGRCSQIYSDCGTNFVGARRQLTDLYNLISSTQHNEAVSSAIVKEGIEWHFNPPSAPHFGGLWEAGIKSVKTHLRKVVGDQILTYEELTTVLTQIEALLNSRPLCALSTDPNDLSALTPGHFLVQEPLVCVPDPDLSDVTTNRLTRWQLLQRLHQDFWKRWHVEYLNTLQQRQKWTKPATPLVEGNLVLIKDNLSPPIRWRLGRIIKTVSGPDGIIRVATVRTSFGDVQRPAVKLCQLPDK